MSAEHTTPCDQSPSCTCADCQMMDDYDPDGRECFWCGGDGVSECTDRLECFNRHDKWGNCTCASCGGSGLAKDMRIW